MKRYLCKNSNVKAEGFLVEARDVHQAKIEAGRWNMTVEAIWYDHPANKGLDEE